MFSLRKRYKTRYFGSVYSRRVRSPNRSDHTEIDELAPTGDANGFNLDKNKQVVLVQVEISISEAA